MQITWYLYWAFMCYKMERKQIQINICWEQYFTTTDIQTILPWTDYQSFNYENMNLMFIGRCIIVIVEEWKTNLISLAILFHFLCAQHVSDINISIIRSLRLCCWITTSVVLFSVRCVLEHWCGWFWVLPVLQAEACNTGSTQNQPHQCSNTQRTENKTADVVIQQHSRKLLMMDSFFSLLFTIPPSLRRLTKYFILT